MKENNLLLIDIDNYLYNYHLLKKISGKNVIPVVKDNAYGLIDHYCADLLEKEGASLFAVASLQEAVKLRKHGIKADILILGYVEDFDSVRRYSLSLLTPDEEYVTKHADRLKGIKVHIKVNTGMNRIGVLPLEVPAVLKQLQQAGAQVAGIMTHLAKASDPIFTKQQYDCFLEAVTGCGYQFSHIHSSASEGSLLYPQNPFTDIRCGIALCGYGSKELKPVVSLIAKVISVKQVPEGESISYERNYISQGAGYILTVSIGYGDGFLRANTSKKVYVEGEYGTIAGNVCMDMILVHTKKYHPVGSIVELYGKHISIEERAAELSTIVYELMTSINSRVTRAYLKEGNIIHKINERFD